MTLYKTSSVPVYRLQSEGHSGSEPEPRTARADDEVDFKSGSI